MITNFWFRLISFGLIFSAGLQAQQPVVISGTGHVESVVWDGSDFLLASIGKTLTPANHDGDGRIIRISSAGQILESSILPKVRLHAPKGLAFHQGILYFTDIDRMLGIRIADGRVTLQLSFIGVSSFLNDVTIWDSNTLYVSDSDKGIIFKVDLVKKTYQALHIPVIPGVNGLLADTARNRLYFVSMGNKDVPGYLGEIDLGRMKVQPLVTGTGSGISGMLDGLQRKYDRLYVSDWAAKSGESPLKWFDLTTAEVGEILVRGAGQGPADFCIQDDLLCMPEMKGGVVVIHAWQALHER